MQNVNINKNTKPLVSIDCLTYNHELYIRDALEGFLMQKTDFTFEVLIHDDASTDQTANIIRKYEKKYPAIIKPIYQKENQYSKEVNITKDFQLSRAKGKYIAICEGDDYWTDPYKLQKQVDFLAENPDYGLVHSDYDKLYEKSGRIIHNFNKNNKIYTSSNINIFNSILTNQYKIATLTVLARTELILKAINTMDMSGYIQTDLPTWLAMEQMAKFHYFRESMGVYRKIQGSISNDKSTYRSFITSGLRIRLDFADKYSTTIEIRNKLQKDYLKSILLKAFYSKNQQLCAEYYKDMKKNGFAMSLLDKLIYTSIANQALHALLLVFDKIKNIIIFSMKWVVRKNLY